MLLAVRGVLKRCPNIHKDEAIVSRHLCYKRGASPAYQKLSDAVRESRSGEAVVSGRAGSSASDRSEQRPGGGSGAEANKSDMTMRAASTSSAMSEMRKKMQKLFSSKYVAVEDENHSPENVMQDEWLTIYRFQHIVAIRTFCRLKIYQTAFTVAVAISALVSNLMGSADDFVLLTTTGISAFTTFSLYVIGNILRRVVGVVYVSPDQNWVKISHIDFWGRRQDRVVAISSLVPLRDTPHGPLMRQLYLSDPAFSSRYFLLVTRFGAFEKPEIFSELLGIDLSCLATWGAGSQINKQETKDKVVEEGK